MDTIKLDEMINKIDKIEKRSIDLTIINIIFLAD